MSLAVVSLLAVTFGFFLLVLWVYWPSRKARMEQYGSIPLHDDPTGKSLKEQAR